ncbi:hypothetical protein D3C85_1664500 [compost metagenome]
MQTLQQVRRLIGASIVNVDDFVRQAKVFQHSAQTMLKFNQDGLLVENRNHNAERCSESWFGSGPARLAPHNVYGRAPPRAEV